jgi:hypothetical protein
MRFKGTNPHTASRSAGAGQAPLELSLLQARAPRGLSSLGRFQNIGVNTALLLYAWLTEPDEHPPMTKEQSQELARELLEQRRQPTKKTEVRP